MKTDSSNPDSLKTKGDVEFRGLVVPARVVAATTRSSAKNRWAGEEEAICVNRQGGGGSKVNRT